MKKHLFGFWAIIATLAFSSQAGALTSALTFNDQAGVVGAYYGATVVNESSLQDVIGNGSEFGVGALTAYKDPTTGKITVELSGPYFSSGYATGTGYGQPGDLYISSAGYRIVSPGNFGANDKFDPLLEGWNYVISFTNRKLYSFSISAAGYIPSGGEPTGNVNHWWAYREGQAYRGGYVGSGVDAIVTLSGNTLTFTFDSMGLDPDKIGYHWTMACGNDVVEGGGTPVPEPGTLLLLGLGFLGLVVCRLRK